MLTFRPEDVGYSETVEVKSTSLPSKKNSLWFDLQWLCLGLNAFLLTKLPLPA